MARSVHSFSDFFAAFTQHAKSNTFSSNGRQRSVSIARCEAVDESQTELFVDVTNSNRLVVMMFSVDMDVWAPLLHEPDWIEHMRDTVAELHPTMIMRPAQPKPLTPRSKDAVTNIFMWCDVEDSELWIACFKQAGVSKKGSWGELPFERSEICDESRTRIFRSAQHARRVGVFMYEVKAHALALMLQPPSSVPALAEFDRVAGMKPGSRTIKLCTPLTTEQDPSPPGVPTDRESDRDSGAQTVAGAAAAAGAAGGAPRPPPTDSLRPAVPGGSTPVAVA